MRVGVGFSENPDTSAAGAHAAFLALQGSRDTRPCDIVLLFATARHDPWVLYDAVRGVVGPKPRILGGGAVGAITNDAFGYAGDQIGLAAIWLDNERIDVLAEGELDLRDENEVGQTLGRRLAALGATPDTSVMLFYDAIDRIGDRVRLVMATPMLEGLEQSLGFLPNLTGAGLQGDYASTPTRQWLGNDVLRNHLFCLAFSPGVRIDSIIMHGCRPATGYYTVTRADRNVILEIDHQPALDFICNLLGPTLQAEDLPFFLILGINRGDRWGEFGEKDYANRLCLAIDQDRRGIVMFEPDMVPGTTFQIMHRSMDLEYIQPRVEKAFARLGDRTPVFAMYINCAGRAAGYAGFDQDDAVMIQETVGKRVPLLGIYSGVEIAPVKNRPQALDWTGVFSLFSVEKEKD